MPCRREPPAAACGRNGGERAGTAGTAKATNVRSAGEGHANASMRPRLTLTAANATDEPDGAEPTAVRGQACGRWTCAPSSPAPRRGAPARPGRLRDRAPAPRSRRYWRHREPRAHSARSTVAAERLEARPTRSPCNNNRGPRHRSTRLPTPWRGGGTPARTAMRGGNEPRVVASSTACNVTQASRHQQLSSDGRVGPSSIASPALRRRVARE